MIILNRSFFGVCDLRLSLPLSLSLSLYLQEIKLRQGLSNSSSTREKVLLFPEGIILTNSLGNVNEPRAGRGGNAG